MNPIFIIKNACTRKWFVLALAILFSTNLAFAQPGNDDCSDAIPLICGDIVSGNNEGADTEALPACGIVFPGQTVWYSIVGTGGDITASTCSSDTNFDSQIGIFSGSCGVLTCVAGNNNDLGCQNPRLSTVTWASTAGTTYYIVVAGVLGASGDYELSIECEVVAPDNDLCSDAEPIDCGDTVIGSTETASNEPGIGFCGTTLSTAPGVWYSFVGTGGVVEVTTCGAATDYDTKLGVFSGSCGSLSCVGGDDDDFGCGFSFLQSVVSFSSTAGVTYYIYVTGFGSNSGTFELSVTCLPTVPNDLCSDSIALDCGDTVAGTTVGAGAESVGFCGTTLTTSGGVWYSVEGTGTDITATTCNAGTNFDTKIGVFEGSCGALVCVGGDDDDPCQFSNLRSRVTWASTAGVTYYILVTGFSSNTGDFELSVLCEGPPPPPANDGCEDAVAIGCDDTIVGNTELNGSVHDFGDSCGSTQSDNISTAPGLWYVYQGNDLLVNLTTCNDGTDYDTKIAVFAGSCDGLVCVAINDNNLLCDAGTGGRTSELEFAAFAGTTYYIYVTGHQGSSGNFEMHVGCAAINDVCENALPIGCGDTLFGNTENANPDSYPSCGTSFSSANGVWYQTTGTGGEMTASTCNPGSNYDTKLFLFEGTCGGLVCIDGNDDDFGCGFSIRRSTITWDSDEGTTYFLLVNGFGSADGNFELSLECEDIEEPCVSDGVYDDVCDADCLEIDVPESFDNTGATVQAGEPSPGAGTGASSCNSQDGWCSFETDVDNSIWFQFVAPASGCVNVGAVDADLQIAVWQATDCGDFGTFTEIGANDDGGPGLAPLLENLAVNPGETYWVQIDGFNGATEDDGTVLVSECTVDSFCDGAVELFCGDTVTGSTVGEPTHDLDFCGTSLTSSGGVWFTFTGVGDVVTLTTCNPGTNYDTKLGVFTGDCTSTGLVCVGGNDDGSPNGTNPDPDCVVPETGSTFNRASTVSFTALAGVDYFIYVTGFSTNEGTFELSVDCMNPLLDNPSGLVEDNSTVRLDASKFAGSEELAISNFYPNPAEFGATNIDIYSPVDGIARIQLFDNIGRLAHNVEVELYNGVNTVALSLGDLPIGAYFANITIGDYAERKKLIIAQ